MKKSTALLALLLALLLVVTLGAVSISPLGLPERERLVSGPTQLTDGSVLVAENRFLTSRVYTLRDGEIQDVYEEFRLNHGQGRSIARMTATDDGEILFIRVMEDPAQWELVQETNGLVEVLYQGTFENGETVTGLRKQDDTVWITAMGSNEAIFVYGFTQADGLDLDFLIPAWWLRNTVSAEYDGDLIRATTSFGDTCFMTRQGGVTYDDAAAEAALPAMKTPRDHAWLLCKNTALLFAMLAWAIVAVTILVSSVISHKARRMAARLTAVGSAVLLLALLAVVAVLFCAAAAAWSLSAAWQAGLWTAAGCAVTWLAGTLLLRVTARRLMRPVPDMTKQMDRVSNGDLTAREPADGRDELSRMDNSLQMMCMDLSVWDYQLQSTVQAYRRFIPSKMAELLERPVVEEIRLGDSRRMEGNVGVFCVGNRDQARNALEDDDFVDFINHSFGIFHQCMEKNHGWMLSSSLRLSAMEALFPDSAADGVRAGLDFLGQAQRQETGIPEPRVCLILHKASFLYGIAGQEERLFPYLSSSELEFLIGFAPRFDQAGVRVVATETYWKQLEGCGFTGRYIGFVTAGEKNGTYKLYEVLDVYPELERALRRGYDQRFQEALNLFYHDDFYLARNQFSALLRACPDDGVARWYLFASERLFNREGDEEIDYSLFGMDT